MFFSDNFSKPHPTAQSIPQTLYNQVTFVADLAACARPTEAPAKARLTGTGFEAPAGTGNNRP